MALQLYFANSANLYSQLYNLFYKEQLYLNNFLTIYRLTLSLSPKINIHVNF